MERKAPVAEVISFTLEPGEADSIFEFCKQNDFEQSSDGVKALLLAFVFGSDDDFEFNSSSNSTSNSESINPNIESIVNFFANPAVQELGKNAAKNFAQKIFKGKAP